MKDVINFHLHQDKTNSAIKQPLLKEDKKNGQIDNLPNKILTGMSRYSRTKYSKLENTLDDSPGHFTDSVSHSFVSENDAIQQRMVSSQDEQLDMISDSIGTLKTVSRQINTELDEQAV